MFDPRGGQLALRFSGDVAGPLNALLTSLACAPARLEAGIQAIVRGHDRGRGKFRIFFVEAGARTAAGPGYALMQDNWRRAHQRSFEGVAVRVEHHKRRCHTAWIAASTLLAVLDHLRRIVAGDFSAVLAASRYAVRRIRIDGVPALIRSTATTHALELEGPEVAGADILMHHFCGSYGAPEFHREMMRTGGSNPQQGHAYWPIPYPYRGYEDHEGFQAMKATWQRLRKRALTQPVWAGGASWERVVHYLPLSTLQKLMALTRRLSPERCRFSGPSRPYVSVEALEVDGFPARRWDMNGLFHQVKLTLPRHNPINWMVLGLAAEFTQDLPRQLESLARGVARSGPGTSFARFVPGHAALDHPEFADMKAAWEAARAQPLDEPVWRVQNDWEPGVAFIPQSSLERLVRLGVWWVRPSDGASA